MLSLKTLYNNYLIQNPTSKLSYQEWVDETFEINIEDISDWDVTLLDGLEDEEWDDWED